MRVKKCWDCKWLGGCEAVKPCDKFEMYRYVNELTAQSIACLLGITRKTLKNWLNKDAELTIQEIYNATGIECGYVEKNGKFKLVVIREND